MDNRVHKCDNCGKQAIWRDVWEWYGSMLTAEFGHTIDTCSDQCRREIGDAEAAFNKKYGRGANSKYYERIMTVYVDKPMHKYRHMVMCHMVVDTLDEFHEMADKIGIDRKWFQSKASTPHYDISKTKRRWAIKYGAIEVNNKGMVEVIRWLRKTD